MELADSTFPISGEHDYTITETTDSYYNTNTPTPLERRYFCDPTPISCFLGVPLAQGPSS
jgi:hypothetical protein